MCAHPNTRSTGIPAPAAARRRRFAAAHAARRARVRGARRGIACHRCDDCRPPGRRKCRRRQDAEDGRAGRRGDVRHRRIAGRPRCAVRGTRTTRANGVSVEAAQRSLAKCSGAASGTKRSFMSHRRCSAAMHAPLRSCRSAGLPMRSRKDCRCPHDWRRPEIADFAGRPVALRLDGERSGDFR